MRNRLYTVRTAAGIVFQIEAPDQATAWQRAHSSALAERLASMMREAVKGVSVWSRFAVRHAQRYLRRNSSVSRNRRGGKPRHQLPRW